MKLNLRYTFLSLAFLASASLLPSQASAEIKTLVTSSNISASSQINNSHNPSNLVYDSDAKYHTWDDLASWENIEDAAAQKYNFGGPQYLEVDLGSPLSLGENEDLIVFIQRCQNCIVRQPTAFRVMGQMAGSDDWEPICYIYFLYRGRSTKEYSARFRPEQNYSKLRFYVTENNSRNYDEEGHRSMGMRQFQVYQLDRNDTLDGMLDPVHLTSDYKKDYAKSDFIHTMGWLDSRNRDENTTTANQPSHRYESHNSEAYDKGAENLQKEYVRRIDDWADWDTDWKDGKWQQDNAKLEEFGITMPDMSFITGDADFNASTSPKDLKRQPTHEMEHILYAVPGDPIILYPYYKFANPYHYEKYEVNFAHWYDYRTGGRIIYDDKHGNKMDLLDFIVDPSQICITNDHGFYGAYLLTEKNGKLPNIDSENYGMFATFFCPRNPLDKSGDVKELPFRDIDKPNGDNDVDEYVIAADFSQSFNKGRNLVTRKDENGNVVKDENGKDIVDIIEPNIAFRHIFRIRDGKQFAEEFSGSEEANIKYTAEHSRKVMARAYRDFQIGLDGGIPKPIRDDYGWWRCAPSKYYYKVSETDCRRVGSMAIRVTTPDGTVETYSHSADPNKPYDQNNLFYFDTESFNKGKDFPMFTGLGNRKINEVFYGVGGGSVVEGENLQYCRFLKSKKNLSGQFKVEIIGEEIIGHGAPQPIKVFNSNRELVVMEYIIDFVDSEDDKKPQAILVTGDKLYQDDKYEFAREETLISKYGEPKDKIDFDYYRNLETLPTAKEYLDEKTATDGSKHYRFKWPASWEKSNYGFGYSEGHNYNMYVVANHSSQTPYHNRWHKDNNAHKDNETAGLYDVLYNKTKYWIKPTAEASENGIATQADEAEEAPKGYFLYVNAANDPGVMITLNAGTLCTGSTINVSAWVAEFSQEEESANIVFNLVAVLKGTGERINVHSYVSGYLPSGEHDSNKTGVWTKIFYSFQPDVDHIGYSSSQIDHYEIELENNCKSSVGADYAIDEIAIYIVTPEVGAEQEIPLCLDVYGNSADNENDEQEEEGTSDVEEITARTVKIFAPFKETLRSIGMSEATGETVGEEVWLNYVIVDGKKFDEVYDAVKDDETIKDPGAYAFAAEGVQLQGGDVTVKFNSNFGKIQEYKDVTKSNEVGTYLDERGNKMIAFRVNFTDDDYHAGKLYYIAFYAYNASDVNAEGWTAPGWTQYDLTDPCSKACKFIVGSTNNIRIDGEIRNQNGELKVCEGESPVISIDIAQKTKKEENEAETKGDQENETVTYKETALCDWYKDTLEDYQKDDETSEVSLYEAMVYFREVYPKATSLDGVTASANFFTQPMLDLIKKNVEEEKLVLSATQYQFGRLEKDTENVRVTAIPMPLEVADKDQIVCTSPMEINISVLAPTVLHGLKGVDYPEEIEDVPLRVGLDQLRSVSIEEEKANEASAANHPMLVIPLRKVATSKVVNEVEALNSIGVVTLESTTDPNTELNPQIVTSESGEEYSVKQEAGVIKSFTAVVGNDENPDDENTSAAGNKFSVLFYDSFPFREGYEYTFSYEFEEVMPEELAENERHTCKGKDLFTIKVVPEYLVWTGSTGVSGTESEDGNGSGVNRNWNNDRNWKRVSSSDLNAKLSDDDLYAATSDADAKVKVLARLKDKVTDEEGTNTNESGFVPMDFTKVIIPATSTALPPYLYDCPEVTTDCPEVTTNGNVLDVATNATDDLGEATKWIEYDMVARKADSEDTSEDNNNIYCGLWYANTCKEIHFLANSSIMNQQYLLYDKAWVDLELNPYRWYTLAMPLKKVFAGEFYLPTAGARQVSELFQDITYDPKKNNRFNPAVFQRGWDKGKALTYLPEPTGKTSSAVVKANWSHVYNDVEESYGSGTGFSIKADVSNVKDASGNVAAPEKVLFRLPKADTQYAYYDHNGVELNEANRKKINHGEEHYKLNATSGTITATTAGKKYFLVGNPFMTYLNMAKFLQANATKIEQKYWIVTSGLQKVAVFDPESDDLVGNASGAVAPMQGFFVEALSANGVDALDAADGDSASTESNATSTLELTYNEDMMCEASFDATAANGSPLKAPTRSFDEGFTLRISALNDGEESTAAILGTSSYASNAYRAEEDMVVLDNSDLEVRATVYTVGDGKALSVNRLEGIGKVELGVIALPDEETVLRFNTEDAAAGLKLYDAQTGIYTSIYDGLTYPITGNASGRLYLTASSDVAPVQASQIIWSASGEEVIVRSNVEAADGLTVKVYDYAGRCVVSQSVADSEVRFRIASGVYVLEAEAGAERLCVQIKI